MAKLDAPFEMTGSIGRLSFYRLPGSDKVIVRTKGGPNREQVRTSPNMAVTRLRNCEFSGRAKAAGKMALAITPLKPVTDFSITAAFNKILTEAQEQDSISPFGKRSVCIAKAASLLEGFNLNRKTSWDQLTGASPSYSVDTASGHVMVSLPALMPGLNFNADTRWPVFSLVTSLGLVPDFIYGDGGYEPASPGFKPVFSYLESAWYPVAAGCPAQTLEWNSGITLPEGENRGALLLAIGLRYGLPAANGEISIVKYQGAGKILAVRGR